jgi:signal peptidase II
LVAVFCVLSLLAAVGILYWLFVRKAARDVGLTVALAAVTAGIFGNLYDRTGLHGLKWHVPGREGEPVYAVRDWIHFQLGWFDWPIFNIADTLLVCGAAVLLIYAFRPADSGQDDEAKPASSGGG